MVPFDGCRIVHLWETLNRNILIIVKYFLIRTCFEIYLAINNDIETASNILWSDIFVSLQYITTDIQLITFRGSIRNLFFKLSICGVKESFYPSHLI